MDMDLSKVIELIPVSVVETDLWRLDVWRKPVFDGQRTLWEGSR